MTTLIIRAFFFLFALPAIVAHEVSHGWAAYALGDPTARMNGRLSLNPIRHIDPFGTLLLPALLAFLGGPVFGYAKPVPINPRYFKDYRMGMLLTGLAGPAANLTLAITGGIVFRLLAPIASGSDTLSILAFLVRAFVEVNLVLMFFNLIPVPPLDGSRVLPVFLRGRGMQAYMWVERYGLPVLLLLIFVGPQVLRVDIIGLYLRATVDPVLRLLTGG